jgi:TolA-binding protein
VVAETLSGQDRPRQLAQVKRLATIYRRLRGHKSTPRRVLRECRQKTRMVLKDLAQGWHRDAQQRKDREAYARVEVQYGEILSVFPKDVDHYEVAFRRAEVLYKLERWQRAAEAYSRVVALDRGGKHVKEAAYSAVLCWKNALNVQEEGQAVRRPRGRKDHLKPRPIPPARRKLVAAVDSYLGLVPASPERVPMLYRKARVLYEHNRYDKAVAVFAEIVTKHPRHELAQYAANLLLDSLNIQKKYRAMERWVERMLKDPMLARGQLLQALKRLKSGMERKAAETLVKEKRYRECGEKYLQMVNAFPDDPRVAELLYNAAICFESAKMMDRATAARLRLIKRKPQDRLAQRALLMVAQGFHAASNDAEAARYYETFARKFPGEREAPEALEQAVMIRARRKEYAEALKDARFFIKCYGRRARFARRVAAVSFRIGEILETQGRTRDALRHYADYLKRWGPRGGRALEIRTHVKLAQAFWKQSCPGKGLALGLCARRIRSRRARAATCRPDGPNGVERIRRRPAKREKARQHLTRALALHGQKHNPARPNPDREPHDPAPQQAVAQAIFLQAEELFEAFLEPTVPRNMVAPTHTPTGEPLPVALAKYVIAKGTRLDKARSRYQAVISAGDPALAIAATARVSQLFRIFGEALAGSSVPRPPASPATVKDREGRRAHLKAFTARYCAAVSDKAKPVLERAAQAYSLCLKRAQELSQQGEWSKLCQRELASVKRQIAGKDRRKP